MWLCGAVDVIMVVLLFLFVVVYCCELLGVVVSCFVHCSCELLCVVVVV